MRLAPSLLTRSHPLLFLAKAKCPLQGLAQGYWGLRVAFPCQSPRAVLATSHRAPLCLTETIKAQLLQRQSFQIDLSVTPQLQPWRRPSLNYMPLAVLERFQRTDSEEETESRDDGDRGTRRERERCREQWTQRPPETERDRVPEAETNRPE